MNGKLIKAALAGTGALALLGAGSTYAFSNTAVAESARVTASTFNSSAAASGNAQSGTLVPGKPGISQTFLVTNGSSDLPAALTVNLANLVDREDGCSANSDEVLVDPDCMTNIGKLGDLSNVALVAASAFTPVASSGSARERCPVTTTTGTQGTPTGPPPTTPVKTDTTVTVPGKDPATTTVIDTFAPAATSLAAVVNGPRTFNFTGSGASSTPYVVAPGSAACVRITLSLPANASNAVQGDTASFDVRFKLEQQV